MGYLVWIETVAHRVHRFKKGVWSSRTNTHMHYCASSVFRKQASSRSTYCHWKKKNHNMLRTHRYRMRGWSAMGEWKRVLRCDCILLRCKPREFDFFVSSELRLSNMCPFFLYFWCWRFAKWNLLFLLLRRKTHKEARSNWAMLSRLSYAPCPLRALCKCWSQSSANHVALPGATLLLTTLHHFFFPFVTHEFASVLLKTAVLLLLYHKLVFFPTLHQSHCNRLFPPLLTSSPASSTFFWTLSIGVLIAFLFFFFNPSIQPLL